MDDWAGQSSGAVARTQIVLALCAHSPDLDIKLGIAIIYQNDGTQDMSTTRRIA